MITFYEGLPRSGKSFSAMKDEIIPRLKAGRKVFAYIEGLDHSKIAPLAEISEDRCRELLIQIEREQVSTIHQHVENDALVVLDEAQNFWPAGRGKLDPDITQFITEHGHRGLDIVIMGQAIADIHNLWRRRVERKLYFMKRTAIGKPDEFNVTIYTAVPKGNDIVFQSVTTQKDSYDKKYFGTYASHTAETTNLETHVDSRGVIWNTPLFKKWIPVFLVVMLTAIVYIWWLFHGGLEKSVNKKPGEAVVGAVGEIKVGDKVTLPGAAVAPPVAPVAPIAEPKDVVEELNEKGRIRLLGYIRIGNIVKGFVEWRDPAMNVLQSMTLLELGGLGWSVMVNTQGTMATLIKGPLRINALAWTVDKSAGRASETQQHAVSGGVASGGYMPSSLALAELVPASAILKNDPPPVQRLPGY